MNDCMYTHFNAHSLHCTLAENPVTIPRVDTEQAWVPTTNTQFEYENTSKLDEALQQQYGEVNSRFGHISTAIKLFLPVVFTTKHSSPVLYMHAPSVYQMHGMSCP